MQDKIKELAGEAYSWFEKRERLNSETFWTVKENRPEWVYQLIYAGHDNGNFFPDDYRYKFIVYALAEIMKAEDIEEPNLEPNVYTKDLCNWLSSQVYRIGYVDEFASDYGHGESIVNDLMGGQQLEMEEVYREILYFLKEQVGDERG